MSTNKDLSAAYDQNVRAAEARLASVAGEASDGPAHRMMVAEAQAYAGLAQAYATRLLANHAAEANDIRGTATGWPT